MRASFFKLKNQGFALLDVFLALLVLSIVAFASYELISPYRDARAVHLLEGDIQKIVHSYSPFLYQTTISADNPDPIQGSNAMLSKSFMQSIPITPERMQPGCGDYCYLVSGFGSDVGFETSVDAYQTRYIFVAFRAPYKAVVQLIQDMSGSMSVFFSKTGNLKQAIALATPLPLDCPTKDCTYNFYLVSPKIDGLNDFPEPISRFVAP